MKKRDLIIRLNARLGISGIEEALAEIDGVVDHSIRYYSRYITLGVPQTVQIEVTGPTYVFTSVVPSSITSVLSEFGQAVDFEYSPPLLSGVDPGKYYVQYVVSGSNTLEQIQDLPDLLEDLIYSRYCKAVNHALNIGRIQIPLEVDTSSILAQGESLEEEAKRMIIEQKDPVLE